MASTTQNNSGEKKLDKAREQLNQGKENFKDAVSHGQEAASIGAQGLGQKAQEVASSLGSKAQEAASRFGHKAQDVASAAQDKADETLSSVGQKVSNLAGSLRTTGPQEGVVSSTTNALADSLDSTGRYLQEHGLKDIGEDLTGIVKSYPIPSMLAIFGVGFLAGMAARR
jgi:hypothetical protein